MSTASPIPEILRGVLTHPTGGVVGLVDGLLVLCLEHGLQLDWQPGRCRVRSLGGNWEEVIAVSLRTSVFRAALARLAALCNEHTPHSVSPYGGQGELALGANPAAVFRVVFVNTPAAQKLELMPAAGLPAEAARQPQVAEAYRRLVATYQPDANTLRPPQGQGPSAN